MTKAQQVLEILRGFPDGLSVVNMATELGVSTYGLYEPCRILCRDGKLTKAGASWRKTANLPLRKK